MSDNTGEGAAYDARLWQAPNDSNLGMRMPRGKRLPPGLGLQYCRDGKWRWTGDGHLLTLDAAAAILHVSVVDLIEWVQKVSHIRARSIPGTPPPSAPKRRAPTWPGPLPRKLKRLPARPPTPGLEEWMQKVRTPMSRDESGHDELRRKGGTWHSGGE